MYIEQVCRHLSPNIDIIILLTYFYLRFERPSISIHDFKNILPINKNKCILNLIQNSINYNIQSTIQSNTKIYNFFNKTNNKLPLINNNKKIYVNNVSICVEQSILELVKLLFWNFKEKSYDLEKPVCDNTYSLYTFMKNTYIPNYKPNKDDKQEVYDEFFNLISNISNVEYSSKGDIISNVTNVLNVLS